MLRVVAAHDAANAPSILEIDAHVPISLRTKTQPVAGARYIRLGNFKTQLLELQFPAESLVLSGFTLVSAEGTVRGALSGSGPSSSGLPIVCLPEGIAFSDVVRIPRIDIRIDVTMSCKGSEAEIRFGNAEIFNHRILYGRVQFLLVDDALVGLRIVDLTETERRTLGDYTAEHPGGRPARQ